jgi:8-oxo-dGTP diphosphatase
MVGTPFGWEDTMIRYVLGFAFNDLNEVCLLRKAKPAVFAGLWNGVGGKIEPDETARAAMTREFEEETGVHMAMERWRYIGHMLGDGWECYLYTGYLPAGAQPRTMEVEPVAMFGPELFARIQGETMPNVQALISMSCVGPAPESGKLPLFLIDYRSSAREQP